MKRNGGRFLWRQIVNARRLGVRTMYGAMWDESVLWYDSESALTLNADTTKVRHFYLLSQANGNCPYTRNFLS